MRMKRFPAKTIPQALAEVQRALGPNAVLLETRQIADPERRKRGELVEVLAAVDPQAIPRKPIARPGREAATSPVAHHAPEDTSGAPATRSFDTVLSEAADVPLLPGPAVDALAALQEVVGALCEEVGAIRREVRRPQPSPAHNELIVVTATLVELSKKVDSLATTGVRRPRPVPSVAWQAEVATTLLDALEGCGLDGRAARYWGMRLNAELAERPWRSGETPATRLAEVMGGELRCAPRVGGGEVHVVLGGSGAGKSSLVVKLALRERLLHDRVPLLISLDHARPEGAALLRRYTEVFGLPLHRVSGPVEIATVIDRLGPNRPCFIDAPATAIEADTQPQVAALLAVLPERAVCHLLLPAATSLAEMRRQVATHGALGVDRLAFSKIDEASHFGQVIAIAAESGLPVSWLTNGRQIPEDLVDASRDLLCTLMTRRKDDAKSALISPVRSATVAREHTEAGHPARSSSDSRCLPISATA